MIEAERVRGRVDLHLVHLGLGHDRPFVNNRQDVLSEIEVTAANGIVDIVQDGVAVDLADEIVDRIGTDDLTTAGQRHRVAIDVRVQPQVGIAAGGVQADGAGCSRWSPRRRRAARWR